MDYWSLDEIRITPPTRDKGKFESVPPLSTVAGSLLGFSGSQAEGLQKLLANDSVLVPAFGLLLDC